VHGRSHGRHTVAAYFLTDGLIFDEARIRASSVSSWP
jgi:hypothetical protein